MGDSVRLFVAVELDEAARHAVMAVAAAVAGRLKMERELRVSWVRPRNLHITLRFLGQVAQDVVPRLRATMTRALAPDPFELVLAPAGTFPRTGAPHVIWVGVQDPAGGFEGVVPEIDERLALAGVGGAPAGFVPHVTMGRIRRAPRLGRTIRRSVEAAQVEPVRWWVGRVTLYESRPTNAAPVYAPLASAALRGRAAQLDGSGMT